MGKYAVYLRTPRVLKIIYSCFDETRCLRKFLDFGENFGMF